MIGILRWLLTTRTGVYVLIGVSVLIAAGLAYLWVWNSATNAAIATATAAALGAAIKAGEARARVIPNDKKAMDHDPFNTDNQPSS